MSSNDAENHYGAYPHADHYIAGSTINTLSIKLIKSPYLQSLKIALECPRYIKSSDMRMQPPNRTDN